MAALTLDEEFGDFLRGCLETIGAGDETMVQYVGDIINMDPQVSDDTEKKEGIEEFLTEATVRGFLSSAC